MSFVRRWTVAICSLIRVLKPIEGARKMALLSMRKLVMETIAGAGVPCSACLDTGELHHDKHLMSRGFVHEMELPVHGRAPMLGFAPRMSQSSVDMTQPPRLGEHTDELLAAELDLSEDTLSKLRDDGVIGDPARFS